MESFSLMLSGRTFQRGGATCLKARCPYRFDFTDYIYHHGLVLPSARTHGMTFPFLAYKHALWRPSNRTTRHFIFQNSRHAMFSAPCCCLSPAQVPVCCLFKLAKKKLCMVNMLMCRGACDETAAIKSIS